MKYPKGTQIKARSPHLREENSHEIIAHGTPYSKPLTVTKQLKTGVRTKEVGFIHFNCILERIETI